MRVVFRKGRGTRGKIANIHWIIEKARKFQKKNSPFASVTILNTFSVWITTNCGIPYLPPENLYADQERPVRTEHEATDWFQIEKGVCQKCILPSCLLNLYAEHTLQNDRLDDSQAGIGIAGRTINNLRCANDSTPMAESEEELKRLLIRMKEENEKAGLKLSIQKIKIMASGPITSWQITGKKVETVADFIFLDNHWE